MAGSFSVSTEMLLCSVSSRQVAEMIGKDHAHLMRDIAGYAKIIESSSQTKFGLADFFIPSTYKDAQNKPRPCYLLTKSCAPGGCFGGRQWDPFAYPRRGATRRGFLFAPPPSPAAGGPFSFASGTEERTEQIFCNTFRFTALSAISACALCGTEKRFGSASVPLRFR